MNAALLKLANEIDLLSLEESNVKDGSVEVDELEYKNFEGEIETVLDWDN